MGGEGGSKQCTKVLHTSFESVRVRVRVRVRIRIRIRVRVRITVRVRFKVKVKVRVRVMVGLGLRLRLRLRLRLGLGLGLGLGLVHMVERCFPFVSFAWGRKEIVRMVESVETLDDPLGKVSMATELDDGLELYRVGCPIGVLCVIFESRPDALVQIAR